MHTKRLTAVRNGFSLVELLVALAALSVMAALLTPALQSARQSADVLKCAAGLRSWGVAFQMYAADNGGFYPFSWINNSDNWTMWMAPYVESGWLTYDPVTFAKRLDPQKCGCPGYRRFSHPYNSLFRAFPYAYNGGRFDYPYSNPGAHIKGNADYPDGWSAGMPGWDPYGVATRYNTMPNAEKICHVPPNQLYTRPAQCVTLFCGIASSWRYRSTPWVGWLSNGGGMDWDVCTGDGLVTDGNGISAYDYNAAPAGVHKHRGFDWYWSAGLGAWITIPQGRDNYLFMDGHVETLDVLDPNVSKYVYNQIPNLNNPYR